MFYSNISRATSLSKPAWTHRPSSARLSFSLAVSAIVMPAVKLSSPAVAAPGKSSAVAALKSTKKAGGKPPPAAPSKKAKLEPELQTCNTQVSQHLVRVHNALKTVFEHDIFKSADKLLPLSIQEGGTQAPFSQKDCTQVLTQQLMLPLNKRTGYKCAMNGLWVNHTWLVNPRVPVLGSQVEHLMKHHYPYDSPPATAPHE